MTEELIRNYTEILKDELVPAMGCTEPIAIAYAAAKAVQFLGAEPDRISVACSGNIIKNVKGVTVPNSGGQKVLPGRGRGRWWPKAAARYHWRKMCRTFTSARRCPEEGTRRQW